MLPAKIWLWKKAPALRLLLPFVAGILLQWYTQPSLMVMGSGIAFLGLVLIAVSALPLRIRFAWAPLQGIALSGLLVGAGMCFTQGNDIRKNGHWFGNSHPAALLLALQEPLIEKPNSYKAIATVESYTYEDSIFPAAGKVILYFKKDAATGLSYGSRIWVLKKPDSIKNSGNPAGFDYQHYSLFNGITHQAYLTAHDFIRLPAQERSWWKTAVFSLRERILAILKSNITGATEAGLAEALLIGYKDDLDKTLVQSYSKTGVVHIIAISGLHVGLLYGLLLLLTKPLRGAKLRWLRFVLVLTALWGFGLLAGAQPSVMRSVVMFSAIAASVVLERHTSVYNNLALSALLLLGYNPFWLWDVGFQLSYIAVLSIIIFFRPVYNWVYLQNKILDAVWKLMAVTLAAQILTTPVSLYYFHQFPLLFLFTNIIAVPLSSGILIGEILLCILFFLPPITHAVGWAVTGAIRLMNGYVARLEAVPFSVWEGLSVSAVQAVLLLLLITGVAVWLLEKKRPGLWTGLVCFVLFTALRTVSFLQASQQQTLVVYNIAKHQAIDVFSGRNAWYAGDATLLQNDPVIKLHLQPSRTAHRISSLCVLNKKAFRFCNKTILLLDTAIALQTFSKPHVDVLILSKNPKLYIKDVAANFDVAQIVIDASVPAWKAKLWQQDCDAMHIPCYDVAQKGAFVMTVPRPTFAAR